MASKVANLLPFTTITIITETENNLLIIHLIKKYLQLICIKLNFELKKSESFKLIKLFTK